MGEESHIFKVKVLNWSKINNKRKDVKLSTWFKLKHDFFDDEKMFDLTHEEKLFWIYILCECSKQTHSPESDNWITVNAKKAHRTADFPEKSIHRMLNKFQQLQIVEIRTLRGRYVDVTLDKEQNRIEESRIEESRIENTSSEGGAKAPPPRADKELNAVTWKAYETAYFNRYKTEPVRNATVNGQISNLVKRLGKEAPDVVRYYVEQDRPFYNQSCHPVGLCLKDAEALRTQWATGHTNPVHKNKAELLAERAKRQIEMIDRGEL